MMMMMLLGFVVACIITIYIRRREFREILAQITEPKYHDKER